MREGRPFSRTATRIRRLPSGNRLMCGQMAWDAKHEMTANPLARGPRVDDERRHAIQTIAEQQHASGQLRHQPAREFPFGLALPPDAGGQRIVQAQFQQHAGRDLGKRGAPATGAGLRSRSENLRGVRQTELRPIERQPRANRARRRRVAGGNLNAATNR